MSPAARSPFADQADLERASADYLAISRCFGLYASLAEYQGAEERAWERLQRAIRAGAAG